MQKNVFGGNFPTEHNGVTYYVMLKIFPIFPEYSVIFLKKQQSEVKLLFEKTVHRS